MYVRGCYLTHVHAYPPSLCRFSVLHSLPLWRCPFHPSILYQSYSPIPLFPNQHTRSRTHTPLFVTPLPLVLYLDPHILTHILFVDMCFKWCACVRVSCVRAFFVCPCMCACMCGCLCKCIRTCGWIYVGGLMVGWFGGLVGAWVGGRLHWQMDGNFWEGNSIFLYRNF